jgi:4-hydroxyphenylpyruvate dioxygenase-like putative hemolysin
MLGTYCSDFDGVIQAVALGYCHVGTVATGVLTESEAELVLASAIAAGGATRSARIHGRSALALGNSIRGVQAAYETAEAVSIWNGDRRFVLVDVAGLDSDG